MKGGASPSPAAMSFDPVCFARSRKPEEPLNAALRVEIEAVLLRYSKETPPGTHVFRDASARQQVSFGFLAAEAGIQLRR